MSLASNRSVKPEQPWFVVNAARHYSVHRPAMTGISHYYRFEAASTALSTLAVPDGCIDILFDCDASRPTAGVYGSPLQARQFSLTPGNRYFGVRFAPGVVPGFIQPDALTMINHEFSLADAVPDSAAVFEQIVAPDIAFSRQIAIIEHGLISRLQHNGTALTHNLIQLIQHHQGNIRLGELERLSGYTCRTLQRQFRQDTGMTPKSFCRITRCQQALKRLLQQGEDSCSALALELGFFDQSHFLTEFKTLTSITPRTYQRQINSDEFFNRIHYGAE